jgi:hypothetical protein
MKCITLWQPWASLILWGEKKIETRSWATQHRVAHTPDETPPEREGRGGELNSILLSA